MIHWHSYTLGSNVLVWEFTSKQGARSAWFNLASCSQRHRSEADDCVASAVGWFQHAPIAYVSSNRRALSVLSVNGISTGDDSKLKPSLSTSFQLNLEQYRSYQEIPSALYAVSANPEANSSLSAAAYILQHVSLLTGAVETVQDLPVWQNYQGKPLIPWQLLCDEKQSAICIKLKDSSKSKTGSEDNSFAYVMAEIKADTAQQNTNDDDGGGNTSSVVRVSCGSLMDALDVSFCQYRSEESKQRYPWLMMVLASTGKTVRLQSRLDTLNSDRISLNREVLRVFCTPLWLSANSPHASTIGSRLLFLVRNATKDDVEMLQMSDDELNVPSNGGFWSTNAHERILDVVWNASTSGKATTQGSNMAPGELALLAVWTTQRLVVLTASLAQVCALDLVRDLNEPQSALWMVHTLVVVTKSNQLRFIAPLKGSPQNPSRLLCSLAQMDSGMSISSAKHIQLLSVCGDRLAYAVTDVQTLETKVLLRPVSICEPLLTGFTAPNGHLRAILEREVLVFALSGGTDTLCPISDHLLRILFHDFGWRDTTLLLLNTFIRPPTSNTSTGSSSGATTTATTSSFSMTSHLSRPLLGSILLHSHQWKGFLAVFLSSDPALEEYALTEDDGAPASKLPSRTGRLAERFRSFGQVLERLGQLNLALKCYDFAGDDLALLVLGRKMGPLGDSVLRTLQKDWKRINEPLSSIVEASVKSNDNNQKQLESAVWRRHDLFSLLCCDSLLQTERRSRLLSSVQPFDVMKLNAIPCVSHDKEEAPGVRAAVLPWKRLAPEDAKDVTGISCTPHMANEDPKNPNYAVLASRSSSSLGSSSNKLGPSFIADQGHDGNGGESMDSSVQDEPGASSSSAKQSIGPFLDEEDAVVAYWRFEEGNTASSSPDSSLECMDTSKRENHLQVVGFGSMMTLVKSSAPVDKGEDNRIQEEFALHFPSSNDSQDKHESEWGAKCLIARGTTLDIAMSCDEDPYRRKFTFEAWVRNFHLADKLQQQQDQDNGRDSDEWGGRSTGSPSMADSETRMLVSRTAASESSPIWAFSLVSGYLTLVYGGHSVKSDETIANAAHWQHVAFSIDITSQSQATIKLFLQGRCVAVKNVSSLDANAANGDTSTLFLGRHLTDYEITEVRLWANVRTAEQLSDMKENYLGIAEAKKRMKIAIHKRNCTCEKCQGRRTKAPVAKLTLSSPFPTTPPTATVRDRRRPGAAANQ